MFTETIISAKQAIEIIINLAIIAKKTIKK